MLVPIGKKLGYPSIHHTNPLARGGNYLYYWAWAYLEEKQGRPARVEYNPIIEEWLQEFPLIRHLSIDATSASKFFTEWHGTYKHYFGDSFTRDELWDFCRALVDSSPSFKERLTRMDNFFHADTCVINVRRGNYYTVAAHEEQYGFDIPAYVDESLAELSKQGRSVEDIVIVSDDVSWCLENLSEAGTRRARTVADKTSMFDDLAALCSAPSLVLANSTFSYWGSYLAGALKENHVSISPNYHYVDDNGKKLTDPLDPNWIKIRID